MPTEAINAKKAVAAAAELPQDDPSTTESSKVLGLRGYRIDATLGQGGMGEVFLAWDQRLHRHVAIKRIRTDLPVDARHRARFRREARAVARLSHPAIVQVFDLLETDEGDCIVMERVEGSPLSEIIASGTPSLDTALHLGREIADGLAEAHAKGLVHRDLKPENVIVTTTEHAKILDFGLARMLWAAPADSASDSDAATLTQAGALVGTVHAMSPEQASGRTVDHRSDLFAFGSLLYEMLTGQAPFRGTNVLDTLRRVTAEEPPPLTDLQPNVPSALVDLVEALLRKDPAQRPQNARLVVDGLQRLSSAPSEERSGVDIESPARSLHQPAGRDTVSTTEPDADDLPTGEWLPSGLETTTETATAATIETVVRTLLHVEVVDRDALWSASESSKVAEIFSTHDLRLRQLITDHDGLEVGQGEATLAIFERPVDAVHCALAHQRILIGLGRDLGQDLVARSAIHMGEVVLRHNPKEHVSLGARPTDVEGSAKSLVGQLLHLASRGQILTTQHAFDLARRASTDGTSQIRTLHGAEPQQSDLRWLAHGRYRIQGSDEPLDIFEVGVEGLAPLQPPAETADSRRILSPSEERMMGWRPATDQTIPLRKHWRLVERIGEGGFGEVWLARHKSGERRVFKFCFEAERLKALKREVTLFRLLKEALGHREDIARILDWQFETAPFFVESEYTEGGSLVRWAEDRGGLTTLPLADRLELAAEVAEALAAAHSIGVLHKDVKPENVLIAEDRAGRPRARLTDFGIGLLTERERLEGSGFTALGFTETISATEASGSGTLGYLAPELMTGQAATIQADIYSLGVMIYQLALGDVSRALAPGWERDIDDELLRTDISCFVDGRPDQRPASALEVAQRLRSLEARRQQLAAQRLAEEEAEARRLALATAQRRRKMATVIAAAAVVVLGVVISLGIRERQARQLASQQAERANQEAVRANREAETSGQVSQFMTDLFRVSDPSEAKGNAVTAREILDRGVERIDRELEDQPNVRAALMNTMGHVYSNLGLLHAAKPLLAESLTLRRDGSANDPLAIAESLHSLGEVNFRLGDLTLGEQQLRRAVDIRRSELGEHVDTAYSLARLGVWMLSTDARSAETLLWEAFEMQRRVHGEEHLETARTHHRWAVSLFLQGRHEVAEPVMRQLLAQQQPRLGEHPEVAALFNNLALLTWHTEAFDEAESFGRQALELEKKLKGEEHPDTLNGRCVLAGILLSNGLVGEAEALHRRTLSIGNRLGLKLRITSVNRFGLAWLLLERGDYEAAEPLIERGLDDLTDELSETSWQMALGQSLRGECLLAQERYEEAEALLTSAYPILAATHMARSPYARSALDRILRLYAAWDKPEAAARWIKTRDAIPPRPEAES